MCLHHFTLPGWFADDLHGFRDDKQGRLLWSRHVDWVGETFGDLVAGWKPINEPTFYASAATCSAPSRPGHRDRAEAVACSRTMHQAGADAARLLRTPATPTATVEALLPVFTVEDTPGARRRPPQLETHLVGLVGERRAARPLRLPRLLLLLGARRARRRLARPVAGGRHARAAGLRALGRGVRPRARPARRPTIPNRPILISEAGIGTDDDQQRNDYVEAVLDIARDAITGGVDLRGIFWWTGVDNYEWGQGFDVRFGLFDRDRNPKPAAEIARAADRADDDLCAQIVPRKSYTDVGGYALAR